jgi:hypothetical protein
MELNEQIGAAVTVYNFNVRYSVRVSPQTLSILTEAFRGFPQSQHINAAMQLQLGSVSLLQNSIQCHQLSCPSALYRLDSDSVAKQITKHNYGTGANMILSTVPINREDM